MSIFSLRDFSNDVRAYYTHWSSWWPGDVNLHISLLHEYLLKLKREKGLPPKLVFNTDGTSKDNKNRTMLAYFSSLIKHGFFKQIDYILLPPGHSHYCVDRDCFAPLGKSKKLINCMTEDKFWNVFVPRSFRKQGIKLPIRLTLTGVFDWRSYFDPFINDHQGIQQTQMFRFENSVYDGVQHPIILYKVDCLRVTFQSLYQNHGFHLMKGYPSNNFLPALVSLVSILEAENVNFSD